MELGFQQKILYFFWFEVLLVTGCVYYMQSRLILEKNSEDIIT